MLAAFSCFLVRWIIETWKIQAEGDPGPSAMLKARLTETGSKSSSRAQSPKLPLNRVSPKGEDHELMPNLPLMRLTAPLYQPTSLNLRQPKNQTCAWNGSVGLMLWCNLAKARHAWRLLCCGSCSIGTFDTWHLTAAHGTQRLRWPWG